VDRVEPLEVHGRRERVSEDERERVGALRDAIDADDLEPRAVITHRGAAAAAEQI
jgi:hypothetical protein